MTRKRTTARLKCAYITLSSLLLTITVLVQTINQVSYSHDFSSYIAAIKYLIGTGHGPYTDFWDIKPLYLFILLCPIFYLTGTSLITAYSLYAVLLVIFFLSMHLWVIQTRVKINLPSLFWLFFIGIVLSDLFGKMFFPSEILGIVLVLISSLIFLKYDDFTKLLIGFLLAGIAGQTKEVYIFYGLAMLLYLMLKRQNPKRVFSAFSLAYLLIFVFGISFLVRIDALDSYLEMSQVKATIFRFDPQYNLVKFPLLAGSAYIREYTLLGVFTPLVIGVALLTRTRNARMQSRFLSLWSTSINPELPYLFSILTSIGAGLIWQAKVPVEHYAISVLPIFLLCCLVALDRLNFKPLSFFLLTVLLLVPNISTLSFSSKLILDNALHSISLLPRIISSEDSERFNVPISRCLQVAYGWEAGAYYYYSNAAPCSKYFLSSLVMSNPKLAKAFRGELASNPPSEIIYSPKEADFDVSFFEDNVFPYSQILRNCYSRVGGTDLYRSNFASSRKIESCNKRFIRKMQK